jgi:hypothetical protein
MIAVAEPDFNLSKSPTALALILNNPLPSPLNNDAVIEPLIFVLAVISRVVFENVPTLSICIPDADVKLAILLPLTNKETKLALN